MTQTDDIVGVGPEHATWPHGIGVVLSAVVLFVGGLDSPDFGFPTVARAGPPELQGIIHGGATVGANWQGLFIQAIFSAAWLYADGHAHLVGTSDRHSNLLLSAMSGLSRIASETESRAIRAHLVGLDG